MPADEIDGDVHLLWVGLVVEGGLIAIALVLSLFGLYDHYQPLNQISAAIRWEGFLWGAVATLPLLAYLAVFHFLSPAWLQPMRDFCQTRLRPIFRGSTLFEMALLSLLAGLGEELLFRWCIQGGLASSLKSFVSPVWANSVGLVVASTLFAACHSVNVGYALTTFLVGLYLGLTMIGTGNFLVPTVAHALYDFVAMIYIVRFLPDVPIE